MSSTKNESKHSNNNNGKCILYEKKRSASALQMSKVKPDRYNKSKLESATDSKLPICNKSRRVHNCVDPNTFNNLKTPNTFKNPTLAMKRKSISLVELTLNTPRTPKKWKSKEHVNELKASKIVKTKVEVSSLSSNELEIARHVCKMFILNAWRHRNAEVSSLKKKLTKIGNEVDNLNIQVVVLHNLLESEKLRVAVVMSDASHLKLRLENELKEKGYLKNEISSLETEKDAWKNQETKLVAEIDLLKGELTLTSEQNKYLRRECDDFDKTVSEAKQKQRQLQEQLTEANSCLNEKSEKLNEILRKSATLLARMAEVKKRNENLRKDNEIKERKINECITKLNDMSVALNNSQNICKVQNEKIVDLKKDLALVEETVITQRVDIDNLRNAVHKYETEKEEFQKNLTKIRNWIVFEAIKVSARLFFPYHSYL